MHDLLCLDTEDIIPTGITTVTKNHTDVKAKCGQDVMSRC